MRISGFDKLSLVDYGSNMTAVIFTSLCNFRCPFCHNAGIVLGEDDIPLSEVMEYLKSRKGLLDAVCISGGEPTLQKDLKEVIKEIKGLGLKVKLDTNGSSPEVLKDLIEENLLDYVAMDIKNNFADYSKISGVRVNIENIQKSIEILKNSSVPHEFRTTLVKEFHSEENIKKLNFELSGAKTLYLQKFVERDSCISFGLHPVEKDEAERFKTLLSSIENVILRGYN